jgi:hypothetical protein
VKGLQSALAQPGDKRGAEPAGLPGIDHGYPASAVPGWSGGKRHGPFGLFRNEAWCLSSAPGPALAGAAQPLLIARAYGATASIAFSIPGRPGGLAEEKCRTWPGTGSRMAAGVCDVVDGLYVTG